MKALKIVEVDYPASTPFEVIFVQDNVPYMLFARAVVGNHPRKDMTKWCEDNTTDDWMIGTHSVYFASHHDALMCLLAFA